MIPLSAIVFLNVEFYKPKYASLVKEGCLVGSAGVAVVDERRKCEGGWDKHLGPWQWIAGYFLGPQMDLGGPRIFRPPALHRPDGAGDGVAENTFCRYLWQIRRGLVCSGQPPPQASSQLMRSSRTWGAVCNEKTSRSIPGVSWRGTLVQHRCKDAIFHCNQRPPVIQSSLTGSQICPHPSNAQTLPRPHISLRQHCRSSLDMF